MLDDQSEHILIRSVVRLFKDKLRVKWDPYLMGGKRNKAKIADDNMPTSYERIALVDANTMNFPNRQNNSIEISEASTLKPGYKNLGLDTTSSEVPYDGPTTGSKGKLKLDNQVLNNDETIKYSPRVKIFF